jgi:hypothetical protein
MTGSVTANSDSKVVEAEGIDSEKGSLSHEVHSETVQSHPLKYFFFAILPVLPESWKYRHD